LFDCNGVVDGISLHAMLIEFPEPTLESVIPIWVRITRKTDLSHYFAEVIGVSRKSVNNP